VGNFARAGAHEQWPTRKMDNQPYLEPLSLVIKRKTAPRVSSRGIPEPERRHGAENAAGSLASCPAVTMDPKAEPLVPDHHVLDADAVAGDHGFGSADPVDHPDVPPNGVGIGHMGASWPFVTLPIGAK